MKRCPNCQRTYPDSGPDFCTVDGANLVTSPDYGYGSQPSGGYPPPQGNQWQAPPTPPPPPDWGHSPLGLNSPGEAPGAGEGISVAALMTGIAASSTFALGYILSKTADSPRPSIGLAKFIFFLYFVMFFTAITAINMGIVSISMAGPNSTNRVKGIAGLCMGLAPLVIVLLLVLSSGPGGLM